MTLDPNIDASETDQQPESQEAPQEAQAVEQPYSAPQTRTYTDADMARARRSFEADAARRQEQAIAAAQIEWQQQLEAWQQSQEHEQPQYEQPEPQFDPNAPWARFDPRVASAMQEALGYEVEARVAPYRQQQHDLEFKNVEAQVAAKYPEYTKNRGAILNYAVEHRIADVETAYRAWAYGDRADIERDAIAGYVKKKVRQSSRTPSVEGRGGGAVSSKQPLPKDRDKLDEAAKQLFRDAQDS